VQPAGFMVAGELVTEGSPTGIKAAQSGHLLEFIVDRPQQAMDLLKSDAERWRVSLFGERLHIIPRECRNCRTNQQAKAGSQRRTRHQREGRTFLARRRIHQHRRKSAARGKVAVEE